MKKPTWGAITPDTKEKAIDRMGLRFLQSLDEESGVAVCSTTANFFEHQ